MSATRELLLELTDVETQDQIEAWSFRLETAREWKMVSENAYELLRGELKMHLSYKGIETESKTNQK